MESKKDHTWGSIFQACQVVNRWMNNEATCGEVKFDLKDNSLMKEAMKK